MTASVLTHCSSLFADLFGAKGQSVAIDTACSSSLVAAHTASSSLHAGTGGSHAAVCGVNLQLDPSTTELFSRAGMLAPDGRCKALDSAADGYVRGEAVAVAVLSAASPAGGGWGSGGAACLLSLRGTAVNQDGRSSSLTAPNGPSQQQAIRAALEAAGLAPGEIGTLMMHGTGTALGDPIELGGATAVLRSEGGSSAAGAAPLVLSATKAAVAHSESPSGAPANHSAGPSSPLILPCSVPHLCTAGPSLQASSA